MAHLMGFTIVTDDNPFGDLKLVFSGLRPGEKLYEELLIGESGTGTEHPKIMRAEEETLYWSELEILLSKLDLACKQIDLKEIRKLLIEAVPGFEPKDEISDPQWEGRAEQSLQTHDLNPKITPLFKDQAKD